MALAQAASARQKQYGAADTCVAADFDELKDAVENQSCAMVQLLPGVEYEIEEEIWVRRRVVVMGNPQLLPLLNGEDAPRTFHVAADGFLELRFVTIYMSEGVYRKAYDWEVSGNGMITEIRGGGAMFDPGCVGGIFTGVLFIDDADIEAAVTRNIERTLSQEAYRIYGGHVFAAGGEIEFIGCLFFDLSVLYDIGNQLFIGANVLQLGGVLTFVGCTFLENTVFGVENGVGLFVAQFAGLSTYTFNTFVENNVVVNENCLAQAFLVAGTFTTFLFYPCFHPSIHPPHPTLSHRRRAGHDRLGHQRVLRGHLLHGHGRAEHPGRYDCVYMHECMPSPIHGCSCGCPHISPTHPLTGVEILTGVANIEVFALGSAFGVGFEYTVGSGVAIHTGSPFNEYNGLYYFVRTTRAHVRPPIQPIHPSNPSTHPDHHPPIKPTTHRPPWARSFS